ncbi:hypothetical protein [Anoxybacillus sp. UARK-01]|uniref:hypothetical protein n=1 Tax=Anoxybacillus sp. UARK-01 TaxID=1895648 RepID=UPI00137483BA|nr:hypothetical protein [Anoxybacillus sp. UARK-01]
MTQHLNKRFIASKYFVDFLVLKSMKKAFALKWWMIDAHEQTLYLRVPVILPYVNDYA